MLDLDPLKQTLTRRSGTEDSVWPSLLLTLFSEPPLVELGPHVERVLGRYLEMIPQGVLRSAAIRDDVGKLTKPRIARDRKTLLSPPRNEGLIEIIYSSGEYGQPGDYGVNADLYDTAEFRDASVLQLEFPWRSAEGDALEDFVEAIRALIVDYPFCSGECGLGFSFWQPDDFALDQVLQRLPRYSGFGLSWIRTGEWMRDRTPAPNWLTFVKHPQFERLGGADKLAELAPDATLTAMEHGVMIRACHRPPVGDVNRLAPDLGQLPGVARFLAPERVRVPIQLYGRAVELDHEAWLGRFDALDNRPWDNR